MMRRTVVILIALGIAGAGCAAEKASAPVVESELHYVSGLGALDGGHRVGPELAFQSLILVATKLPGAPIEIQLKDEEGVWGPWESVVFAAREGSHHASIMRLPGKAADLRLRSDGGVSFVRMELFAADEPTFDDDLPDSIECAEDSNASGTSCEDSEVARRILAVRRPGRWMMPPEVHAIAQRHYLPYESAAGCSGGGMRPGARALADFLVEHFPGARSYQGYACRAIVGASGWSVHATGRAIDLFVPADGPGPDAADNDLGDPIANWLVTNAQEIGVSLVIWDRSSWGAHRSDKHRPYRGAHPHHDHLHIELTSAGAALMTPWFQQGMPFGAGAGAEVFAIKRRGQSGATEVHVLRAADRFQSFRLHAATALPPTDGALADRFELAVGDYNGDGRVDLYVIDRRGESGRTEVHVLRGSGDFDNFSAHAVTALDATDGALAKSYEFGVGDFNGDGRGDLYAIHRSGGNGRTEVHVLGAAGGFERFLVRAETALHGTGGELAALFDFAVGDFDGDGRDDLYAIRRGGERGRTEIHVLGAAESFEQFLVHATSTLHATDGEIAPLFEFGVGDFDGDGRDDVYAMKRNGDSGRTEIHILDAASGFGRFLLQAGSALHPTDAHLAGLFELRVAGARRSRGPSPGPGQAPAGCGDGVCAGDETDASCPADCGCSAASACGGVAPYGCFCDSRCETSGDCCADVATCR